MKEKAHEMAEIAKRDGHVKRAQEEAKKIREKQKKGPVQARYLEIKKKK